MNLSPKQREKVHEIVAQHTGQCVNDPVEALEKIGLKDNREALAMIDNSVFYCENCSWWCDTDERHETDHGEVCTDCAVDLGAIDG